MILTGKEIKERTGKHLSLEDDREYIFDETPRGSSARLLPTEEEKQQYHNENVKEEAYQEFLRVKEIYGETSEQATSAKQAYVDAFNGCSIKCRSELETELTEKKAECVKWFDKWAREKGGII